MRISAICSIFLSLSLVFLAGCGGDTGESVGNERKTLRNKIITDSGLKADEINDPMKLDDAQKKKLKDATDKNKAAWDANEAKYGKLSADEKKKADAIQALPKAP